MSYISTLSQRMVARLSVLAWAIWLTVSFLLLGQSNASVGLYLAYAIYCLLVTVTVIAVYPKIFSPIGIFIIFTFTAFGMSIPLFASGAMDLTYGGSTDSLFKMVIALIIAMIGFIGGYLSPIHHAIPFHWVTYVKRPLRNINFGWSLLILAAVVLSGVIRITLHIGEAGILAGIPFEGVLRFILYDGVLILCLLYLGMSLKKKALHTILALAFLLAMAVIQAQLGWKGGVVRITILALIILWYQKPDWSGRTRSMGWILIPILMIGILVPMGNAVRVERGAASKESAHRSTLETLEHYLIRAQGGPRLVAVLDHFGSLTLVNNFNFIKLNRQHISTTEYVDTFIHNIDPDLQHSVGASGIGGLYTAGGLLSVLVGYGIWGAIYRSVYKQLFAPNSADGNVVAVVLYAMMFYMLIQSVQENFNLLTLKAAFAYIFLTWCIRILATLGRNAPMASQI